MKRFVLVTVFAACTTTPDTSALQQVAPEPVPLELPCESFPGPRDHVYVFDSGGVDRRLILHVPARYDGEKALPLVLVLHGFGGTARGMVSDTKLSCKAEERGFLVAYLDGTRCDPTFDELGDEPRCTGLEQGWNNAVSPVLGITVDDVQFARDTLAYLAARWRIDDQRIYVSGFSNGAMMTHRLASEMADVFAGAAAVSGLIARDPEGDGTYLQVPDANGSIPMMIVHGTADGAIGYDGTTGHLCPCNSVDEAVAHWVEENHCLGPSYTTTEGGVTTTAFGGCRAHSDVTLVSIDGGGHDWPLLATDAIWSFFDKRARTAAP